MLTSRSRCFAIIINVKRHFLSHVRTRNSAFLLLSFSTTKERAKNWPHYCYSILNLREVGIILLASNLFKMVYLAMTDTWFGISSENQPSCHPFFPPQIVYSKLFWQLIYLNLRDCKDFLSFVFRKIFSKITLIFPDEVSWFKSKQ